MMKNWEKEVQYKKTFIIGGVYGNGVLQKKFFKRKRSNEK